MLSTQKYSLPGGNELHALSLIILYFEKMVYVTNHSRTLCNVWLLIQLVNVVGFTGKWKSLSHNRESEAIS